MEKMENSWYLVSSHGSMLFYIAVHPGCTIEKIANDMSLTRRTVWGLIGDLRNKDMLIVQRKGRRHHYKVDLDAPFLHPVIGEFPLRIVLGRLIQEYAVVAQI